MKTYIHFEQYPGFKPMVNPNMMAICGVYEDNPANNKYQVSADHGDMVSIEFFNWFYEFYRKPTGDRDREKDMQMIALWVRAIWRVWDNILLTEDPISKRVFVTEVQKQTLLELGWNWEFKPNFDRTWMFQQFPLTP